ncbi:hypothetical protein BAUCODRAFT_124551 [Baudoinia panamericana UAMH 10762]|uniref:Helicase ATP-binding domain-containing protein n=1 Tax=Baudoinia panamericana (strain UAMH 10762) TaxID=717646 RepID=M2MBC0_BAUPA|nr:uncharacterized protein BAUCODRAFT_124551 [Baudoinia panamericana UAMH 10762]EMC93796.1 hypothetical protein BAUCODRAFT_124551 [Baudoinia panamericana UAMH 10762]
MSAANAAENGTADDDDEDDEDDEDEDDDAAEEGEGLQAKVLNAYRKLLSRRVDLVGDYAGDELFIIEGDSMLLRCFSDPKLDFDTGFQMLHAAYNVEHFLHQLVKRKCNFHIVFFDSNQDLCIPPSAIVENAGKYHLARTAIIRHLQSRVLKSHPTIAVEEFSSCTSEEFTEYLRKTGPYFLMMHDGAEPTQRRSKHITTDVSDAMPNDRRAALRQMILHFIRRGYNIALVNGLEWRDTKVMTMVLEARHRSSMDGTHFEAPIAKPSRDTLDAREDLKKLKESAPELSPRQALAVLAVRAIQNDPPSSVGSEVLAKLCCIFLLHQAYLQHLPLSARRVASAASNEEAEHALCTFASLSDAILRGTDIGGHNSSSHAFAGDLADYTDGRIFLKLVTSPPHLTEEVKSTFDTLITATHALCDTELSLPDGSTSDTAGESAVPDGKETSHELAVLPFSNPVFDKHLAPVHLKIDDTVAGQESAQSHRIFQELTHWHNAKKPLIQKGPPTPKEAKAAFWAAKREQLFMAEMRTYAASLTNAIGKSLEPETIVVGAVKARGIDAPAETSKSSSVRAGAGGGGGKNAAKNAGKQAMLAQIAATRAKKDESAGDKVAAAWHTVCRNLEADTVPRSRFRKAKDYLTGLQSSSREVVEAEVKLYMLNCVLQYWIDACRRKEQHRHVEVTALIWSLAGEVVKSRGLTKTIVQNVELTETTLNLPPLPNMTETQQDRKLGFAFSLPSKVEGLAVRLPSKEFQLTYCGPYLERSFDSKPDSRVDFNPDGWQRKVLDGIDAQKSVFAVAPTSAGKTFISFYAMRMVLEADDDGVLVYVAPTKALVNQIAAEIQARYSKRFKHGGKSVWAIHTRDYRINNPTGCQVLVTVPHVLQIMLLAPSNAAWSSRVRRIIFDEVHSIGQAEDGVVWEQLLLMAPCPIIALSATVGNPEEFSTWLTDTQKAIGIDLVTVQHPYRYSDLRKYYYVPPERFTFAGLPEKRAFGTLGLDGLTGFQHVHSVAGLIDRSRGIPQDLGMEPRDCLELWRVMVNRQTEKYPVPADLDPEKVLPVVSRKADVLAWEARLKDVLRQWIADSDSPYDLVVKDLEQSFRLASRESTQVTQSTDGISAQTVHIPREDDLVKTTLPLLCRLNDQDALPAILFNYDRNQCEKLAEAVLQQLQDAETAQRKSGPKWEKHLERWEEWKKMQEKNATKQAKAAGKKSKPQDEEKGSKLDQQRDAAESGTSVWETFNPDAPLDGYHFADYTRLQLSELEIYVGQLNRRNIPQMYIDALQRGIGVHHAGLNRKLRQVVEILFRKGFLRVVIATGTLAMGINMPCKTVVFSGDSVFLTALNYRQCAGRAGRRGFDLLGNVVFQGVSRAKVCRLISSRLPSLNGHFPLTTTLVLRLFTLLHESKNSKYAVGAINALLSQPRLYMGGPSFKDQTMHHLRFSIEYLRRQHLLGTSGAPLNFAGLVSHLYFTENSSFAFHALLKEGYFHELCADFGKREKNTVETLMLVMSHLFNRIYCRQADAEFREKVVKPSSSMVFLPPLPKRAASILRTHNQETLDVYRTYVETFVEQHMKYDDRKLPLTGLSVGGDGSMKASFTLSPTKVRSPFVALSGSGDDFDSIADLCRSTRDGVFLEEAVVPHVDIYPDELEVPLNAWLLDFFKHGDVITIEKANGIRRADIWFLLNDFSLVLATIITSLLNFLKLKEGTDMDMLDVMGDLDVHDEAEDNEVAASEEQSTVSGPSVADSVMSVNEKAAPVVAKKKAKNKESWEEVADEEDESQRRDERRAANAARLEVAVGDALNGVGGSSEGLKDVLRAFQKLHTEFNVTFRKMWA